MAKGTDDTNGKRNKITLKSVLGSIRKPKKQKTKPDETNAKRQIFGIKKPKKVKSNAVCQNLSFVDGFYIIQVKKTADNHSDWLKHIKGTGKLVHAESKYDYLPMLDFQFDDDTFELVIIKQNQFEEDYQFIDRATELAISKGYLIPEPEMGAFLLDTINPEIFEEIGLKSIQIAHTPLSWKDALLIKNQDTLLSNPKHVDFSIQFVVAVASFGQNRPKKIEMHAAPYITEKRIVPTRGIAFLVPKK